jgi:hypothetical protein
MESKTAEGVHHSLDYSPSLLCLRHRVRVFPREPSVASLDTVASRYATGVLDESLLPNEAQTVQERMAKQVTLR